VGAGTLLVTNTSGSATGTGSVSVSAGATLAGTGLINASASGKTFSISGTSTSARANVLVGQTSASDINTSSNLSLQANAPSTITYANLAFNLNSNVAGAGNELNVGTTNISFGAGNVLTLNLFGTSVIAGNTAYVLIAGTGTTSGLGGTTTGQYAGLSTFVNGLNQDEILNSGNGGGGNLALSLPQSGAAGYYGTGSYLFIVNSGGVDNIEVMVIPEPSTWAMMLGGLALLLFIQRKRGANYRNMRQ
jgi:hypothetical protein